MSLNIRKSTMLLWHALNADNLRHANLYGVWSASYAKAYNYLIKLSKYPSMLVVLLFYLVFTVFAQAWHTTVLSRSFREAQVP